MLKDCKDMQFIWAGVRESVNQNVRFFLNKHIEKGELIIFAADFYQVFINGEFCSYGPERTAAGYARIRRIPFENANEIEVKVTSYNVSTYICDRQLPYFAARIVSGGEIVAESKDFVCEKITERMEKVSRYTIQRGFIEVYDYRNLERERLDAYAVTAPVLMECIGDNADYSCLPFEFENQGIFKGFDEVKEVWWKDRDFCSVSQDAFNVVEEVAEKTKDKFVASDYSLKIDSAGFLRFDVEAEEETVFYAVFDEYINEGKWVFRRSWGNDCVCFTIPKGKHTFITAEPYVMKYLKILQKGKAVIKPALITLQNRNRFCVEVLGNDEAVKIFNAAVISFRHNVLDIYMDCPGRERAGWLFDSRFMAFTERMLYGNNRIERSFLENFNLADTPELEKGMLPDCFPAQHESGQYIPTFAMWYVIQVGEYYKRTGDRTIVDGARKKAYDLYAYFQEYINSDGLLEDLGSWVFVEWSVANTPEYTCGVNYPSNMVYAEMLRTMSELYADKKLLNEAQYIRNEILKQSYNGEFFTDNATRKDGKLIRRDDHISETCQYYALTLGYRPDETFAIRMMQDFGPFRKEGIYPNVGKSNMLPGHYMRFFWLLENNENDRVVKELTKCVKHMAETSGTLWEHDTPTESLDHGFTSAAAVLLVGALTGYKTVKDGIPVFGEKAKEHYGITVNFSYENGKSIVES